MVAWIKKLSISERLAQVEQELAELKLQVKKNAASVSIEREVPRRTDEKNALKEKPAIQTKKSDCGTNARAKTSCATS